MKKNINICQGFSLTAAMLIATMFVSCVKFELEAPSPEHGGEITFGTSSINNISKAQTKSISEPQVKTLVEKDPNDPSSFGLDVMVQDGIETPIQNQIETRGVQLNSINAFDVAAYYHVDVNSESKLYFADTVVDGVNTSEKTHYWPSTGYMNFVATYPTGLIEDGISTLADNSGNLGSFTYTIPTNVIEQQDVMIAVKNNVDNAAKCQDGTPVSLDFHHLFAAVRFKVGKMIATRINSLTISDVQGGTIIISYNEDDDSWEYSASNPNASYSPVSTTNGAPNVDTYGLTEGNYITGNDNRLTMFVMPQVLNNAKITINYTELITNTTHTNQATLSGEWIAGKTFTYIINIIADHLQVTLPNPPDADAHYVRVDMDYDLSGFAQYAGQGVTISDVKATASWLNDGSNTASNDKQSIRLKKSIKNASGTVTRTELTEMQKQGYYTDEEWTKVINGDRIEGPKLNKDNILGDTTEDLDISNKGTLHLFLDENDGDTNRNGQLKITATVTVNGIPLDKPIILAQGNFKQLHPYWNNGIGVERFEDDNTYPYGFSYNRKVVYTNISGQDHLNSGYLEQLWNNIWSFIFSFLGFTTDTVLPEIDEDIADNFVKVDTAYDQHNKPIIESVTIDYTQLSNLKANNKAVSLDGFINTRELYDFTGNVDLAAMEEELNNRLTPGVEPGKEASTTGWQRDVYGSNESNPEYYAAYIALTRNKMRELITTIKGNSSTDDQTVYQAIMHKEKEGSGTNGVYEDGVEIIEWFLPSKEDAQNMKEVGSGLENTPISPLDGIYWSSTAGDDPVAESNIAGYAYTYTFNINAYSTSNAADRTLNYKVRAVRKKPTAN